jgi:leucine dehydrogenase
VDDLFDITAEEDVHNLSVWSDPGSGLRAICVIDDVRLGPAACGIRTQPYPSTQHALADAARLATAMTRKTALAGLRAGGGSIVVLERPGMDRDGAFRALGRRIGAFAGAIRGGPDLGTRTEDLMVAAAETPHVQANIARVSRAVAKGVRTSIEACVRVKGDTELRNLRVAVQGCGAVGAAVARGLAEAGASLVVADVDSERARVVAEDIGAEVVEPAAIFEADVDVFSPCAMGGVLTDARAAQLKAWAVCGGANNILASKRAEATVIERGILLVPDIIASAGGVIEGVGYDVMGLDETGPLIEGLGRLAEEVLREAKAKKKSAQAIALARAEARLSGR